MTIHEKLERLTTFCKKTSISRAAGLGAGTLDAILRRRTQVTSKTGIALARVLSVDAGWLLDDAKRWPPVRAEEPETCHAA